MQKKLSTFTKEHPFKRSFISQHIPEEVLEIDQTKGKESNVIIKIKKLKSLTATVPIKGVNKRY